MKPSALSRLSRLEEIMTALDRRGPSVALALSAIVARHLGEWRQTEAVADAAARALGFRHGGDLKKALAADGSEALRRMALLALSHADRRGTTIDALFDEIPAALRQRLGLLPRFADYLAPTKKEDRNV